MQQPECFPGSKPAVAWQIVAPLPAELDSLLALKLDEEMSSQGWGSPARTATLAVDGSAAWLARPGGAGAEAIGCLIARVALDEAEILWLGVASGQRRAGAGRALVEHFMAWASGRGCPGIHLEVRASNAAALALYRRLGFRDVGRRSRYYRDGEDAVCMMAGGPS